MKHALVVNTGSSSLKWSLFQIENEVLVCAGSLALHDVNLIEQELQLLISSMTTLDVVGHRVVFGGPHNQQSTLINDDVCAAIESTSAMNPLHATAALMGIRAIAKLLPNVIQIAAFDTMFHQTLEEHVALYPIPFEWSQQWSLRRYGYHGLSVAYAVQRSQEMIGSLPTHMIVCHLGSGCSMTALRNGCSIDTTMGFTPLDGMMMATRSGAIDPGLIFYLKKTFGFQDSSTSNPLQNVEHMLNYHSGLLGVSGVSADVREVKKAANEGSHRASLAYKMFVHSARKAIGSMFASLGGQLDAIVFTGGLGEHDSHLRSEIASVFSNLGLRLNEQANSCASHDTFVHDSSSKTKVIVVHAREDLALLKEIKSVLNW